MHISCFEVFLTFEFTPCWKFSDALLLSCQTLYFSLELLEIQILLVHYKEKFTSTFNIWMEIYWYQIINEVFPVFLKKILYLFDYKMIFDWAKINLVTEMHTNTMMHSLISPSLTNRVSLKTEFIREANWQLSSVIALQC